MTKDIWRGVPPAHRIKLLVTAMGDLPRAVQEQLLADFFKGVKNPQQKDLMMERNPLKSLVGQIELAVEQGWHLLYKKDPNEFRDFLAPLLEKARKLRTGTPGGLPCLLVFPYTSVEGGRIRTIKHVRYRGQPVTFDPLENIKARVRAFKDTGPVPKTPYLAVDVRLGEEYASSFASEEDDEKYKDKDPTPDLLATKSRLPLTIDEGLALCRVFETFVHVWPGLRLLGTTHYGSGWADLEVSEARLELDEHNLEIISHFESAYVPHCEKRIGM